MTEIERIMFALRTSNISDRYCMCPIKIWDAILPVIEDRLNSADDEWTRALKEAVGKVYFLRNSP